MSSYCWSLTGNSGCSYVLPLILGESSFMHIVMHALFQVYVCQEGIYYGILLKMEMLQVLICNIHVMVDCIYIPSYFVTIIVYDGILGGNVYRMENTRNSDT